MGGSRSCHLTGSEQTPMTDTLHLMLDRDSVAAGDDVNSHQEPLAVDSTASVADVLRRIDVSTYLPAIDGGKATWIFGIKQRQLRPDFDFQSTRLKRPLAIVAQQWEMPRFLVPPACLIADYIEPDTPETLQFAYWAQADPTDVFNRLHAGQPPPSRWGGQT